MLAAKRRSTLGSNIPSDYIHTFIIVIERLIDIAHTTLAFFWDSKAFLDYILGGQRSAGRALRSLGKQEAKYTTAATIPRKMLSFCRSIYQIGLTFVLHCVRLEKPLKLLVFIPRCWIRVLYSRAGWMMYILRPGRDTSHAEEGEIGKMWLLCA